MIGGQIFLISFLVAMLSVPVVRYVAIRLQILDAPNARKVHTTPIPLMGGLAVLLAFLIGIAMAGLAGIVGGDNATLGPLRGILAGGLLIFAVGLYDDKFGVRPLWKFIAQFLVAILLVLSEVRLSVFIEENLIVTILTVIWIVGIINSFNLLDNMNGLSSGVALIAALTFGWIAFNQNNIFVYAVSLALAGALAGYLPHNFPNARIFLGDAGSMLIGFILAAISVQGVYLGTSRLTHLPVITPILVLAVPLFDTFSVIVIRLVCGLPIFAADKNHFSHRLVDLGLTKIQAVLFIYLVAIAVSIPPTLLASVSLYEALLLLLQEAILFAIIVVLMRVGITKQQPESE